LIFNDDCDGTCLTWLIEYNSTYHYYYHYQNRLYIKKAEQKPIKMILKGYDIDTHKLISTDVTTFVNWNTGEIPDYEYDYPMDLKTCYWP
jgi:hypothetical protein